MAGVLIFKAQEALTDTAGRVVLYLQDWSPEASAQDDCVVMRDYLTFALWTSASPSDVAVGPALLSQFLTPSVPPLLTRVLAFRLRGAPHPSPCSSSLLREPQGRLARARPKAKLVAVPRMHLDTAHQQAKIRQGGGGLRSRAPVRQPLIRIAEPNLTKRCAGGQPVAWPRTLPNRP